MWRQLRALVEEVRGRSDIRVAVIRGDGERAFSAGADISGFETGRSGEAVRVYDDLVEDTCRAIEAIAQPSLAVIAGACMGAGVSIAASCDLRIAAKDVLLLHPGGAARARL